MIADVYERSRWKAIGFRHVGAIDPEMSGLEALGAARGNRHTRGGVVWQQEASQSGWVPILNGRNENVDEPVMKRMQTTNPRSEAPVQEQLSFSCSSRPLASAAEERNTESACRCRR